MNILSGLYIPFNTENGSMVFVINLYNELASKHNIKLVALNTSNMPIVKFEPILLEGKMTGKVNCHAFNTAVSKLKQTFQLIISSETINIIHAHHLTYPPIVAIGELVQKIYLPPIVLNIHGSDILSGLRDKKHIEYIKRSCQIADMLICPTKQLFSDLEKICSPNLWEHKIKIIPLAVGNEMLEHGKKQKQYTDKEKFNILYSGRLTTNKGVHLVIRALSELPTNINLKIAGEGQKKKNLKIQVNKLKLQDRVKFLGHINWNKLKEEYFKADVVICPSQEIECFCQVALEAMANKTPVIGTRLGGIIDAIGDAGILIDTGNYIPIKHSILVLYNNLRLREKLGQKGRDRIEKHFTFEKVAESYMSLFEQVLKNH